MSESENQVEPRRDPREDRAKEVECPKCGHHFWHDLKEKVKKDAGEALNGVGNAIGEAKFGE